MTLDLPRNSTNYHIARTDTFRLGSRMITTRITSPPREGKVGSNMQNWEGSIKRIFLSDGWNKSSSQLCEKLADYLIRRDISIFTEEERLKIKILCKVDQRGAEALVVAYLCRNGNYRSLFLNGIKSHVYVAMHVFSDVWQKEMNQSGSDIKCNVKEICNLPIGLITSNPFWKPLDKLIRSSDKWPAQRRYYYIGKQICHSSNYGIRAGMYQMNTLEKSKGKIVIAPKDAEYHLSTYHSLFSEIREWHKDVEKQLTETKTLYNLFGYPREFWFTEDIPSYEILKTGLAFPAQSTVATITNKAITEYQEIVEQQSLRWDVLGNEHDSFLTQCPIGEEKENTRLMQQLINCELIAPSDGSKFNMESEAHIGWNWSGHSSTNPLGLIEL